MRCRTRGEQDAPRSSRRCRPCGYSSGLRVTLGEIARGPQVLGSEAAHGESGRWNSVARVAWQAGAGGFALRLLTLDLHPT